MMSSTSDAAENGMPDRFVITADRRPSVTVVEAISSAANTAVEQLPILYDALDPDALDALFATRPDDTSRFDGQVSFTYAGFLVTVGDRAVTVRPAAE